MPRTRYRNVPKADLESFKDTMKKTVFPDGSLEKRRMGMLTKAEGELERIVKPQERNPDWGYRMLNVVMNLAYVDQKQWGDTDCMDSQFARKKDNIRGLGVDAIESVFKMSKEPASVLCENLLNHCSDERYFGETPLKSAFEYFKKKRLDVMAYRLAKRLEDNIRLDSYKDAEAAAGLLAVFKNRYGKEIAQGKIEYEKQAQKNIAEGG
jgi:hypothetical protein